MASAASAVSTGIEPEIARKMGFVRAKWDGYESYENRNYSMSKDVLDFFMVPDTSPDAPRYSWKTWKTRDENLPLLEKNLSLVLKQLNPSGHFLKKTFIPETERSIKFGYETPYYKITFSAPRHRRLQWLEIYWKYGRRLNNLEFDIAEKEIFRAIDATLKGIDLDNRPIEREWFSKVSRINKLPPDMTLDYMKKYFGGKKRTHKQKKNARKIRRRRTMRL